MKFLFVFLISTWFLIIPVESRTEVVKKSKTNICHAPGTKYYKAFKTLKDCLDSGGRLPKRK